MITLLLHLLRLLPFLCGGHRQLALGAVATSSPIQLSFNPQLRVEFRGATSPPMLAYCCRVSWTSTSSDSSRPRAADPACRYFTLQLAESYLTGPLLRQILARIERLAWHPT